MPPSLAQSMLSALREQGVNDQEACIIVAWVARGWRDRN